MKQLNRELVKRLGKLSIESKDQAYFDSLGAWFYKFQESFEQSSRYDELKWLVDINIEDYPTQCRSVRLSEMIDISMRPKSSIDAIVDSLRNVIMDVISVRISKPCQECRHEELILMQTQLRKKLALECPVCGKLHDMDLHTLPLQRNDILLPPKKRDIPTEIVDKYCK